ncbi:MAG: hypothetical protein ACYDGM_02075 [Vulcanimicrobiaceae bacterium]
MADCFVTGIAPTRDIAELEKMLGSVPNLDQANLSVITTADRSDRHNHSFLNFIHAGGPHIDAEVAGAPISDAGGIITGSGGTGVPGIGADSNALGYLGNPYVVQHVGSLPIPEDEADNYNDALDDGRCVIAYKATNANCVGFEAAFKAMGLKHVKTFE